MAFGAGYAQAEDRLFLMDVLRHYGEGTLASFLGSSCDFEQMDHDQLLLRAYTPGAGAGPGRRAAQGVRRAGRDGEVDDRQLRRRRQRLRPRDPYQPRPAARRLRRRRSHRRSTWTDADVVAIAGLIGGIFGKGGGIRGGERRAAAVPAEAARHRPPGASAFQQFKEQQRPARGHDVVDKSFPYEIPGKVDPATTAHAGQRAAPLTGGPSATDPGLQPDRAQPDRDWRS